MYMSCALEAIYGGHAFPEPELLPLIEDRDAARVGVELIGEVFGADTYSAPSVSDIFIQTDDFTQALATFYDQINARVVLPSIVTRIDRAIIYNSVLHVDGAVPLCIYETQRANDRAAAPIPDAAVLATAGTLVLDPGVDHLFVGSAGSFNYGHFLVDDLPRLGSLAVMRHREDRPRAVLMTSMGLAMDSVREEAVRLVAGPDIRCRFLPRDVALRGGPIFFASPVSSHPLSKNPAALRFVRDRLSAVLSPAATDRSPLRLFILRSSRYGRTLNNKEAVAALLAEAGFLAFDPEAHSFSEQATMFMRAQAVVGQMGAAMTNTMFCPSGAECLYLAPRGWIEPFYWDLAVAAGQQYRVMYGATSTDRTDHHLNDFSIDIAGLTEYADLAVLTDGQA